MSASGHGEDGCADEVIRLGFAGRKYAVTAVVDEAFPMSVPALSLQ